MGLISLLFNEPLLFFILAFALLYSVIAHEVAHGWVALLFGDPTAKLSGRLTLNPASHVDPLGALMLFLVGFGWARPVPVDYGRLRRTRAGLICVSLAGCAVNILIAVFSVALLQWPWVQTQPLFSAFLLLVSKINIILAAFNLIPIPPLDGSKILMGFLPESRWRSFARMEPFGFFILILLLVTGLLTPVILFLQALVYKLIAAAISLF